MGQLGTSSRSNGKGNKSITYKTKEKFRSKKVKKKTATDKRPIEKTAKVYSKGQKGGKLAKSRSLSANKGHKQLEDADSFMEKDADMRDNENSSDDDFEESDSEIMQNGSDADGNDDESDVVQDEDDDDDDDDDVPTDIEEPEIEDPGKTFRTKKRPRLDCEKKKLSDLKRKNYAEPEPATSKVDGINLPRKKQLELFQPCKWDVCERVKTSELNFSKWLESHSHREQYFIGDDGVSKKRVKIMIFSFFNNVKFCSFLITSTSTPIQLP